MRSGLLKSSVQAKGQTCCQLILRRSLKTRHCLKTLRINTFIFLLAVSRNWKKPKHVGDNQCSGYILVEDQLLLSRFGSSFDINHLDLEICCRWLHPVGLSCFWCCIVETLGVEWNSPKDRHSHLWYAWDVVPVCWSGIKGFHSFWLKTVSTVVDSSQVTMFS